MARPRKPRKTETELFGRPYVPKEKQPRFEFKETPEEKKKKEGEEEEESTEEQSVLLSEEEAKNPLPRDKAVTLVETETVWDKRINKLKEMFRMKTLLRKTGLHEKAAESKVVHKLHEKYMTVKDKIEDLRETYDTSQHPMIEQLRTMQDKLLGETPTGYALGELMKIDPDFNLPEFVQELEEYLIPMIIKGYLRGDKTLLYNCVEDQAEMKINQSLRLRENQKEVWDDRILDVSHIEVAEARMINDVPHLHVTFVVQQVNCIRDARTGEIVRGNEAAVVNEVYSWLMRRDFEGEDFDWKIAYWEHYTIQELTF